MLTIPAGADFILRRLMENGFDAYVVGGCVRDSLLGLFPHDWDICTSARPEQMQAVFADCRVIETGLKHGTLTVLRDRIPYEVTTFRVDGGYTDHRHPDSVSFVSNVVDDLARRDFTVNAMAWNPQTGLVDAFHGQEDLRAGIIRAVGDPKTRFTEDALRILRALRFASVYAFRIDDATSQAAHDLRHTLTDVAAERIRVELAKLLCGQGAADILRAYPDVVFVLLPQLRAMHGFDQHNPHHRYDVWEHTLRALPHIPPTETLRLAILLHDSGKPDCFTLDEAGIGHMHGHAERSAEIADEVLSSLRVDNATRERVTLLVRSHSLSVSPDPKLLRRRLNQLGEEALRELLLLQRADQLGKGTISPEEIKAEYRTVVAALDALMATSPCFTLKSLAVSGRDLMAAGLPKGHIVGQALAYLLDEVMAERLPNARMRCLTPPSANLEGCHDAPCPAPDSPRRKPVRPARPQAVGDVRVRCWHRDEHPAFADESHYRHADRLAGSHSGRGQQPVRRGRQHCVAHQRPRCPKAH